jgi:hypothetical protein
VASVRIDFVRPTEPDLVALRIFEASAIDGVYDEIERVTPIGTYPNYISYYTTDQATSVNGWFRIQWENSKGALSELSQPAQGGVQNLVAIVVGRMLLRDPSIEEAIAVQEAEAVIQWYFSADPYTVDPVGVSYNVLSGLTLMAMARCYLFTMAASETSTSTDVSDYTAGLVSQRSGTRTSAAAGQTPFGSIDDLIAIANYWLGTSVSIVMLMEEVAVAGGLARELVAIDQTRLIVEFE